MSSPEAPLFDDSEARRAALDTSRSFIVQAPAGSGKTELLIQRYLFLLLTVDVPEEILAITFTRKAAAEMRLRILDALSRAAAGERPSAAHETVTHEVATAVLERDRVREWQLLINPGRMRVQTLDSLNSMIARMQPLTASSGGGAATVVDEGEMALIYEQAAAATLDWLEDDSPGGRAAREVLLHVDNNTGIYVGQLARMLKTRDQWLPFISSGEIGEKEASHLRHTFETTLEKIVTGKLSRLRAAVPPGISVDILALSSYAVENLKSDGKEQDPICTLETAPELPGCTVHDVPQWLGMAELLLTRQGAVRKQVNKNQGFPPKDAGQKKLMSALLESLADDTQFVELLHGVRELPPAHYADEQWQVLLSLFRLLPIAVAELRRLTLARGITDYVEIGLCAGEALGEADSPGDVALLLDYQVRHILVDEMQDTSKAQYRMLESLTGGWEPGDGRTLFCVGDPMQSIYRFRNAEVAQFLLAREQGIGSVDLVPLVLRRNFRSGEHLVDWFNRVFPRVLPARDDPANGAVSYANAVPVDSLLGQGECCVHPVFGSNVRDEAAKAVAVIQETLAKFPADTLAVLVRSRTQLPALLQQLREASVTYQAVDIDRLTDLPEIIDILALTRAISHAGDRLAWLALLRSPWIGLDWSDLHRLVYNKPHETVPELLRDEQQREQLSGHAQAALQRFVPLLEKTLAADRSAALHRRVERAWFQLGGPALADSQNAITNIYNYLEALARFESGGSIPDIELFTQQLDKERVSTNQPARVQIMTMHKAKGLQFDHVLLYGLGRYPAANRASVLSWLDLPSQGGREEKLISPIGRRDELESDPLHKYIERTEGAKDRHEYGRLLYVACTRARKKLHLIGNVGFSNEDQQLKRPRASSLLHLLWPFVEADYEKCFAAAETSASADETPVFIQPRLRRFDKEWQLPAVSPLSAQPAAAGRAIDEKPVEYSWVGADARIAGTVVHRWLQRLADGRIPMSPESLAGMQETTNRWLRELGAGPGLDEPVRQRVFDAIDAVLEDPSGQWLLQGAGDSELALTGQVAGKLESVVIDRIRIDEDGTHWLVDYKTSSHEGGNLEGFLDAEIQRYRPQLQKYAIIYRKYREVPKLRCALYFPVLQRLVDVAVD